MKDLVDMNPNHFSLWHIDYDDKLTGLELREKQKAAKKELVDNFIENCGVNDPINEFSLRDKQGHVWYYSTTHAKGTTAVVFARWPMGIDCQANDSVPDDYLDITKYHFNESEQEWLKKHNDPMFFLQLWVSKESFYKCYFIEKGIAPDFNQWKLFEYGKNIGYKCGDEVYVCDRGIGGNKYTFAMCFKR